jgi:hypothetical protein
MSGLHLSPEMLEAAYTLLQTTPPFRGWKLPHADDVQFQVASYTDSFADARFDRKKRQYVIRVSRRMCKQIGTILVAVAHEMCHVAEAERTGKWGRAEHGAIYNRLADSVCRWHGFDRGAF